MAAKDYKICPAGTAVYIAKESKRNPGTMTSDRREITHAEIISLIKWYTHKYCIENKSDNITVKINGEDYFTIKANGQFREEILNELGVTSETVIHEKE